ncbi:MAG: DUF2029 domain-containing protein [bacterium]|nr:DUF2029 domain-containing protein [bacterium]
MPFDDTPSGLSTGGKVLLLLILLTVGGVRWHAAVLEDYVKPDETVYVNAAKLWSEGRSPYEEDTFFYTPLFAWISSGLTEQFGTLGYLKIQRTLNLAGVCVATWLAFLIAAWRWWPAALVSVAWLWFSPVVALPIQIGNANGLSMALTLAGLHLWLRAPIPAGTALGLGQALKPTAPLAPFCLLAHRRGAQPLLAFKAGTTSVVTVGILLLVGVRYLPGILGNASGSGNPYNFSFQHVLASLGLQLRPIWIVIVIGVGGLAWIASHRLSKLEFLVATLTLNFLAAPILWAHSLLPFLPVHLLAAERSLRSLRQAPAGLRGAFPHIVAGLAIASTVFSASIGGLSDRPAWIQGTALGVPLLSLLYLGVYVLNGLRGRKEIAQLRPSQSE